MNEELAARIRAVPGFTRFPSVDELTCATAEIARSHPGLARTVRVGTSRLGDPIECLQIGSGERSAVVFGGVHPNEPIGGLTSLHLARSLCEDEALRRSLGLCWYIIPCIDPDGARLNEGWFNGPFTRSHYGRHFYRPPADEQVEWTFPFQYKDAYFDRVLPETLALMRLIDAAEPALMCSLHNGELGGVYYYLSRPLPTVYGALKQIPTSLGLPLALGEPEVPYAPRLDDAIFAMIRAEDRYDFAEQSGLDPATFRGGASSASYAARHGTLTLVSELPYWIDERSQDQSATSQSYADLLLVHAKQIHELTQTLCTTLAAVENDLRADSSFLRATRGFLPDFEEIPAEGEFRAGRPEAQRAATVAEEHSLSDNVHCFRLRYAGMLLRALDAELAIGNGTPVIRRERATLAGRYQAWCDAAEMATPDTHVPIGTLVGNQFGAILATAAELVL